MPSLDFDFDADDEEEGFDFEDEDVPGLLLDEGLPFEVEVDGLFLLVLLPPPSRRLFEGTGAFFLFLKTSKSKYSNLQPFCFVNAFVVAGVFGHYWSCLLLKENLGSKEMKLKNSGSFLLNISIRVE